jgi:hypothetical protein
MTKSLVFALLERLFYYRVIYSKKEGNSGESAMRYKPPTPSNFLPLTELTI